MEVVLNRKVQSANGRELSSFSVGEDKRSTCRVQHVRAGTVLESTQLHGELDFGGGPSLPAPTAVIHGRCGCAISVK